jgi:exodeoxyribonuclease VII small subunit
VKKIKAVVLSLPFRLFNQNNKAMSDKQIKYGEAVKEIEQILNQIEKEELDVDDLTAKVKRASELLSLCRSKLRTTEQEVEKIMKEIESE